MKSFQISINALGKRYTPTLNFELPLGKNTDGISRNSAFKKQLEKPLFKIFKVRRAGYLSFSSSLISNERKSGIDGLLASLREIFNSLTFDGFKSINFNLLLDCCGEIITELQGWLTIFYTAQDEAENEKPTNKYATKPYANDLQELYALINAVKEFNGFINTITCRLANNPFLILKGEAGYGKSHFLGDLCRKREGQGFLSILLLGQHFTGNDNPWHQVLHRQLNLSITEDDFLGQLNIKAHLTGKRIVLVVDAINEGNGRDIWPDRLKTFISKIRQYDGIGLVVSIRTSYHKVIVDESIYQDNLALNLTHYGFSDFEYEASDYFFEEYKINKPRIPLLHPEFRSPLFLKLFCDGLAAKGLSEIPEGYEGITAILNFFLEAINIKLSSQMNYDPAINVIKAAVQAFAHEIIDTHVTYVPYIRAVSMIASLEQSQLTNNPGILTSKLVEEGILMKNNFTQEDGTSDEGLYFLYDRFLDHMVAKILIEQIESLPTQVFQTGGGLYEYFRDCAACRNNSGLVEAFSIQIPEKYEVEFFELVPNVQDCAVISEGLIGSIIWRNGKSFSSSSHSRIFDFLKIEAFEKHGLSYYFLENILLISSVPGNPFNAEYLHEVLISQSMPDRDSNFLGWLNESYENVSSGVRRLVDWSWKDKRRTEISDESILLSSMALAWFLISPNRNIRDSSTKSIICLLQYREHLLLRLLEKFETINDPYVYERLICVAYGCCIRAVNVEFVSPLCTYLYNHIFNKRNVYANILVRDYARGIIEFASFKGIKLNFNANKCNPPYRSRPISKSPTISWIDKNYRLKPEDHRHFHSQNRILDSMTTEYGRGTGGYGDFGRYTFQSALSNWRVSPNEMSNYGVKRIFELGYDLDLHGDYDSYQGHGDGKERIGKKYQWIVLHEVLARVSDNAEMRDEIDYKDNTQYKGAWQAHVRDIDPSVIIKETGRREELPEDHVCWWLSERKVRYELSNRAWMNLQDDLPSDKSQILLHDDGGNEWLCLELMISGRPEAEIDNEDYRIPTKRFYKHLRAYITSEKDFKKLQKKMMNRNRLDIDLPDPSYQTQVFSREYYWSLAYGFHQQDYYGGNGDFAIEDRKSGRNIARVHVPSQYILWEKGNDYSTIDGLSFYKPSTQLFKELGLSFMHNEGELADSSGNLACFDPSVNAIGPSCLLVRKELLLKYLIENELRICWTVTGEKNILSARGEDEEQNPKVSHFISGFYYIDTEGLQGDTKSIVNKY